MIGQVIERATVMRDEGARWDAILEALRSEGFSKVDCIRATVEILRLPLADAKRIVHDSRAWADRRKNEERRAVPRRPRGGVPGRSVRRLTRRQGRSKLGAGPDEGPALSTAH